MAKANQFTANEDRRDKIKTLDAYLSKQSDGKILSWEEIGREAGIPMDTDGRSLVRHVLEKMHRRWLALPDRGIELSSCENADEIQAKAGLSIKRAVDRAKDTTESLARHLPAMSEAAKQRFLTRQALFGALDLSTSLTKRLPRGGEQKG